MSRDLAVGLAELIKKEYQVNYETSGDDIIFKIDQNDVVITKYPNYVLLYIGGSYQYVNITFSNNNIETEQFETFEHGLGPFSLSKRTEGGHHIDVFKEQLKWVNTKRKLKFSEPVEAHYNFFIRKIIEDKKAKNEFIFFDNQGGQGKFVVMTKEEAKKQKDAKLIEWKEVCVNHAALATLMTSVIEICPLDL
jgi:hypothetical protein